MKCIVGNILLKKIVQCFFSDKSSSSKKIYLIENGKLLTDDSDIAETFNKYLQKLVHNLDLKVSNDLLCQTPGNDDKVLPEYQNRPSVKINLTKCNFSFSFNKCLLLT